MVRPPSNPRKPGRRRKIIKHSKSEPETPTTQNVDNEDYCTPSTPSSASSLEEHASPATPRTADAAKRRLALSKRFADNDSSSPEPGIEAEMSSVKTKKQLKLYKVNKKDFVRIHKCKTHDLVDFFDRQV
jgi:hypothetical protein